MVRDWRILWMAGCWLLVAAVMFGMVRACKASVGGSVALLCLLQVQ